MTHEEIALAAFRAGEFQGTIHGIIIASVIFFVMLSLYFRGRDRKDRLHS